MRRLPVLFLALVSATALAVSAQPTSDPLAPLSFLVGNWQVPRGDSALARNPRLAGVDVFQLQWIVGGKAIRLREGAPIALPDSAELEGTVYWDPAQERIRFVAVAGHRDGQGRLFIGEFIPYADGRVERVYDVYYRSVGDMPGESAGGSRRRYRDVWERVGADRIQHTLEWWWEGRWQPYARGRYELDRRN